MRRYDQAQRMHEATGGVLYGADSSRWPARWADAVTALSAEEKRADAAFDSAVADYRRSLGRRSDADA